MAANTSTSDPAREAAILYLADHPQERDELIRAARALAYACDVCGVRPAIPVRCSDARSETHNMSFGGFVRCAEHIAEIITRQPGERGYAPRRGSRGSVNVNIVNGRIDR